MKGPKKILIKKNPCIDEEKRIGPQRLFPPTAALSAYRDDLHCTLLDRLDSVGNEGSEGKDNRSADSNPLHDAELTKQSHLEASSEKLNYFFYGAFAWPDEYWVVTYA
jgi:hypothetical protein